MIVIKSFTCIKQPIYAPLLYKNREQIWVGKLFNSYKKLR